MASVFLSYDHGDVAIARPLAAALEKAGHDVWWDRHIHGGAQYSRKIEQALDAADAVVVLWSERSLDSAWVRDEAAEGRDRGKLVPLSLGRVTPPMGFRQFQTIELGDWKGRGKVPELDALLHAVRSQAEEAKGQDPASAAAVPRAPTVAASSSPARRNWVIAAASATLLVGGGGLAWVFLAPVGLPVVEVAAANSTPRSQAAASELFVKLGSLAEVGQGKWKLVDAASAPAHPEFQFRTADTGFAASPQANLVLLDGQDSGLLWSHEFRFPAGGDADLRQQMALTAGRVLGCLLESRDAGGLRRDLLKLFLNVCGTLAENSVQEPTKISRPLRQIVTEVPEFIPAWGRLLNADVNQASLAAGNSGDVATTTRQLRNDMATVRQFAPDLPELALAEYFFLPSNAYSRIVPALNAAVLKYPDNAVLRAEQGQIFQAIGLMTEGVAASRAAAQNDPLSPAMMMQVIVSLAYAGQIDAARAELGRAEKVLAGTGTLKDIEYAFNLRFGPPAAAKQYASFSDPAIDLYLNARSNPSPENISKLVQRLEPYKLSQDYAAFGFAIQALGEFNRVDDSMAWIGAMPSETLARYSYLLFRPGTASIRRDPRFPAVAKRIGLMQYWRASGKWPDFCSDPELTYNCKTEATKP